MYTDKCKDLKEGQYLLIVAYTRLNDKEGDRCKVISLSKKDNDLVDKVTKSILKMKLKAKRPISFGVYDKKANCLLNEESNGGIQILLTNI